MKRPRPQLVTEPERLATLEAEGRYRDEKLESIDQRIEQLEQKLKPVLDFFVGSKFVRWIVAGVIALLGTTAISVSATIAALRFFTGH